MLVEIGPVPADSARAYVALCRERLPALGADRRLDATLTSDVRARFDELLDAWESAATDDVFLWSADVDPDVVEHVFFASVNLPPANAPPSQRQEWHLALI